MKFKEFFELVNAGMPVLVECKAGVDRWEGCYPEAGMRMEVVAARITESDVGRMSVDYTRFDEFNQGFEPRNYYDAHGNATKTAREAGWYTVHEDIYVDPEDEIAEYFELIGDERKPLLLAYEALPAPRPSYVTWLESRVLSATQGNTPASV